ncbi:uncharacterized protein BXZ73DRAFT_56354 [Epithele typhae]|uniref:uncharacterized protein n=1 Tax=Epithele typhae TaxID=378194 RepID=UPI002007DE08|nr:uncharacterized protein BXZ73DRAFT_56354 [Epithele typhae]KAH9912307.1 hypothetical protein BXZ73DRAFT_56354 [Epithele typhae]
MFQRQPGPCRLINTPKGCYFGKKCKFSHDVEASGGRSQTSSAPSASRTAGPPADHVPRPSPRQPPRRPTNVPSGVCDFFWGSGACARGFECRFKHVRGEGEAVASVPDEENGAAVDAADDTPLDIFSPEGLAAGAGGVQQKHQLDPSEVHNYLQEFLRDGFAFTSPKRVQAFVRILASVNDGNKAWNTDSAQELSRVLVKGNGLRRIEDVLRFSPVTTSVGTPASAALSFQRGYFPLVQFLASDLVLKSTLHQNVNALYSAVLNNHDAVFATLQRCISEMMTVKSWKDHTTTSQQSHLNGLTMFRALSTVLLQYFQRFRNSIREHDNIPSFVQDLASHFNNWADDVCSNSPRFEDSITAVPAQTRNLVITHVRDEIARLGAIVERESGVVMKLQLVLPQSALTSAQKRQAWIAQLAFVYDPPGALRASGPRHDNDHELIRDIAIAPTHDEIFAADAPYLPVFSPDAEHHLPADSMDRHLDIQFRLLREELISTTRTSLTVLHDDLVRARSPSRKPGDAPTQLEKLLAVGGGAYRTTGPDSAYFQLYTGAELLPQPPSATRRGLAVALRLDAPPASTARDANADKRAEFWARGKRLQNAGLVALVVVADGAARAHLGTVTSSARDLADSARGKDDWVAVSVAFFDAEVELMALRGERLSGPRGSGRFAVLVDGGVLFDAVRPFLRKLQTVEPTAIPFARYIARGPSLAGVEVQPPLYARQPLFKFRLQCLAREGMTIADLDVGIPKSVERARDQLRRLSVLDPSQAEAVVDTFVREISLIQGPPGTGKSYTAKEIIRVFISSEVRPIVLIAFTNHALDHMVESVLDGGITDKIVRLGNRSDNEKVAQFSLDKIERSGRAERGTSAFDRSIGGQFRIMKELEEEMTRTMMNIRLPRVNWHRMEEYLDEHHRAHADSIRTPPTWIARFHEMKKSEEEVAGEFHDVQRKKAKRAAFVDAALHRTMYGLWRKGEDIAFLSQPKPKKSKKGKKTATDGNKGNPTAANEIADEARLYLTDPDSFFRFIGERQPTVPRKNRCVEVLKATCDMWSMSQAERTMLAEALEDDVRKEAYRTEGIQYAKLKKEYEEACEEYDQMREEIRRRILSDSDLIACTTTGTYTTSSSNATLQSVRPRVLMVEEAGQVLEAHILASLVPSVHHLICIGDPQQLRPTLANYTLSMDSNIGKELYRLDKSLMERLHDNQYPMSQINVQRRMRPEVSHFIRTILYPKLEDNALVLEYPHVRGMQKDVFFLDHQHKENGTEDSVSKHNMYEVKMIKDLVLYFLNQGTYSQEGDIAVLCAYLGQLQKFRAALSGLKVKVILDERDEQQLAKQELDEQPSVEEVSVTQQLRSGTVDIFQGREAKIVIVSLVRNSGQAEPSNRSSIGFLKSVNRINVALSRAKHGLYVLGNTADLRQNDTWATILTEMEAHDQIGSAFPTICPRHPEQVNLISQPGVLTRVAPAGGCLRKCNLPMPCGHTCTAVCHAVLDDHRSASCPAPCTRTPCARAHPCPKRCSDDCGDCVFPVYKVSLPCGHTAPVLECHVVDNIAEYNSCSVRVRKQVPDCQHWAVMPCHQDPSTHMCKERCNATLPCCKKQCEAKCHECKNLPPVEEPESSATPTAVHMPHNCGRKLYCQHPYHSTDVTCQRHWCRRQCLHQPCTKPCSVPCEPCMEPCAWVCEHVACPLPCSAVCIRLPCDEPCQETLSCGHPCPSVCGEPCAVQTCARCLLENAERKKRLDYVNLLTLAQINLHSTNIEERLITLTCGHIFTVETLDSLCNMRLFYEIDPATGQYLSFKAPPPAYQAMPLCPRCQGPVTALRYGRVTKRATMDIMEQNVAHTMSKHVDACAAAVQNLIANTLPKLKSKVASLKTDSLSTAAPPAAADAAPIEQAEMLPTHVLRTGSFPGASEGLADHDARAWATLVGPALAVYDRALALSATPSAHATAHAAARQTLAELARQMLTTKPTANTDALEADALAALAQPPPHAGTRFRIEACVLALQVRAGLAEVAKARAKGLGGERRERWEGFVGLLYRTCAVDAEKVREVAEEAKAARQAARAAVLNVGFTFERVRWEDVCERAGLERSRALDRVKKMEMRRKIQRTRDLISQVGEHIERRYLDHRGLGERDADAAEARWLDEQVWKKINVWKSDCDNFDAALAENRKYDPGSSMHVGDVMRLLSFSE